MLNELLEVAFRASTTGNMQLYSVIVTRDEENKKKLAPAHFNQPTVTTAPVVLTFCADFNRFIKWCELRKAQHGYDNFQSFYTATIDALLVAQQFCTAAELCGLGICYLGTTTYNAPMHYRSAQPAQICRTGHYRYSRISRRNSGTSRPIARRSTHTRRTI